MKQLKNELVLLRDTRDIPVAINPTNIVKMWEGTYADNRATTVVIFRDSSRTELKGSVGEVLEQLHDDIEENKSFYLLYTIDDDGGDIILGSFPKMPTKDKVNKLVAIIFTADKFGQEELDELYERGVVHIGDTSTIILSETYFDSPE